MPVSGTGQALRKSIFLPKEISIKTNYLKILIDSGVKTVYPGHRKPGSNYEKIA